MDMLCEAVMMGARISQNLVLDKSKLGEVDAFRRYSNDEEKSP